MRAQIWLVVAAILLLVLVIELMRRQRLREKYAALWLLVSAAVLFFAVFPRVFTKISNLLGFGLPVNLAFALAVFMLLAVAMQLSFETGRLEDRVQRLAEEVALLRADLPPEALPDESDVPDRPGPAE